MTLKHLLFLPLIKSVCPSMEAQNYNNIEFIENKGQWDSKVKFKGDVKGGAFFIRAGGFTVLQNNADDLKAAYEGYHGHKGFGKTACPPFPRIIMLTLSAPHPTWKSLPTKASILIITISLAMIRLNGVQIAGFSRQLR